MNLKIIKGSIENLEKCEEALVNSELGEKYFPIVGSAKKLLRKGFEKNEIYVAINEEGEVVGFIWIKINGAFDEFPYLHLIAVNREHRGIGIAKKLIYFFEELCFKDYTKVFLVVADFNYEAKKLYKQLGYIEIGGIPNLYREGFTEYFMMKSKF